MPLVGGRFEPLPFECVAQMRPTGGAAYLDPVSVSIGQLGDGSGDAVVEGRPAAAAVELRGSGVQGRAAALAVEAASLWVLASLLSQ